VSSSILWSCSSPSNGEEKSSNNQDSQAKTATENCMYVFNPDSVKVSWTAFKTTQKIGVGGTFDEVTINNTQEASVLPDVFTGASFEIPINTVNTNNPDRDKKIKEFFFGKLIGAETITGKLKSLGDENKAMVSITLNGVEKDVEMQYEYNEEAIILETIINVVDWNAQTGIDALNEVCYDLHKAADGISKLWPDVAIQIEATLDKNCE